MALFDNNGNDFASRLKGIDKYGVIELIQEVNKLTQSAEEYDKVFTNAFEKGEALTKRQKDAFRGLKTDVENSAKGYNILRDAISETNNLMKNAPKNSAEKKELSEKIKLFHELQSALTDYNSKANSAISTGQYVANEKQAEKVKKIILDVGKAEDELSKKPVVLNTEQAEKQAEHLANSVKNTGRKCRSPVKNQDLRQEVSLCGTH